MAELSPWRCGFPAPVCPFTKAARLVREESVPSSPSVGAPLSAGANVTFSRAAATSSEASVERYLTALEARGLLQGHGERCEVDGLHLGGMARVVRHLRSVLDGAVRKLDQRAVAVLAGGGEGRGSRRESLRPRDDRPGTEREVHGRGEIDHAVADADHLHGRAAPRVRQLLRSVDAPGLRVVAAGGVEQDVPDRPPAAGAAVQGQGDGAVRVLVRALDEEGAARSAGGVAAALLRAVGFVGRAARGSGEEEKREDALHRASPWKRGTPASAPWSNLRYTGLIARVGRPPRVRRTPTPASGAARRRAPRSPPRRPRRTRTR